MIAFGSGPFTFDPAPRGVTLNGSAHTRWTLNYASQPLAQRTLPAAATQDEIRESFASDVAQFVLAAQREHAPARINLVEQATDRVVATLYSHDSCGMTPGLIDDRAQLWLRSADRRYTRAVTLSEFAQIAIDHAVPSNSWIAGLLGDDVLTSDINAWRAPTAWEIRHVVGEGSFTGLSGARAAALVGVTPANFRKYTARDSASTRQTMSYSMWHLLLHKLGVQRA